MSRRSAKQWAGHRLEELRERWGREHVYLYGKIDSTNAAARELAEDDAPSGAIILCREQTAGRGRGSSTWHSPPDLGLYLSMVFRPGGVVRPPIIAILAGLGIVRELDLSFPKLGPALKWPNDLMVDDRKLGGILGEASWAEAGPRYFVVGVGINVGSVAQALPRNLRSRSTWLKEHAPEAELIDVADAAVRGLEKRMRRPPRSMDAPTLDLVDAYDWLKNRRARVLAPGAEEAGVRGICVGIAPDGALLFRPDKGALRRIDSGHVEVTGS